jgi:outer membrane protein assembly factor BamB
MDDPPEMNMSLARREFLGLLTAMAAKAQSTGKPVNLDEHGETKLSGVDAASQHVMAGMNAAPAPAAGPIQPVFTRSGGNLRHGAYSVETRLTPAVVRGGLRKLFTLAMTGDKRGMEAQPLFAPSVRAKNGQIHDLCICSTMANQVWAFDANSGRVVWKVSLGKPVNGSQQIDAWLINDHWGILSTGVVDDGFLYCVAWISGDGSAKSGKHSLFKVRLSDGRVVGSIALSAPGVVQRKQRAALTLTNVNGKKTVFIPWGTIQETADGAHGFITAVDLGAFQVVTEWSATPTGKGSGIWMAGQGLCADDEGFLYCLTGNGDFDGVKNFSESFLKLRYEGASITVVDWWSPWRDADRGKTGGWDDMDLGAGGAVVIPELGLVCGAGKDGILYVLDWRRMGQTKPEDFANPQVNYGKLKSTAGFFTYFPGFDKSPTPNDPKSLDTLFADRTHHMHGTPLYWNNKLYCMGENGNLRAWSIEPSGAVKFLARSEEVASPFAPVPPGGMPGGMLCLSSNGLRDGVVWACVPDADANKYIVTGRVFAFDASDFSDVLGDGDHRIKRLWMSDPHYTYNKFNVPVVNGGRLYVPTYDGTVDVYGI